MTRNTALSCVFLVAAVGNVEASITVLSQQAWAQVEIIDPQNPAWHPASSFTVSGASDVWKYAYVTFPGVGAGRDYVHALVNTNHAAVQEWDGPYDDLRVTAEITLHGSGLPFYPWHAIATAGFSVQFTVDVPMEMSWSRDWMSASDAKLTDTTTGVAVPFGDDIELLPGAYTLTGSVSVDDSEVVANRDVACAGGLFQFRQPTPEPATLAIWTGLGAVGLVAIWRRRRRAAVS